MDEHGLRLQTPLSLNYKEGEKIKISPIGDVIGVDGRAYKIDGAAVTASINKGGVDLPLDENHFFGPACGWFAYNSIELREDGIYAALELNEVGKDLVDKKKYRYLSPAYLMGENRQVTTIDGVGLVNRPNLLKTALNNKNPKENNNMDEIKELNAKLDVKSAELAEANKKLEALSTENSAVKAQLAELNKKFRAERVENAIKAGELLANKRDFALSLENNAQLEAFLTVSKNDTEHLTKQLEIEKNAKQTDDVTSLINEQLGIKEEK
jgi:phage I-like protein